jgi:glycosyltransferase involved in cell wall biosynthesis
MTVCPNGGRRGRRVCEMKIAIVVPGRFYAFELAAALTSRGHDVTVFTNYPKWATRRFGLSSAQVRTLWPHGVGARIAWRAQALGVFRYPEAFFYRWFGEWASKELAREEWDVVHCFSGSSEEVLRSLKGSRTCSLLARGSAHIRTQARILEDEKQRAGIEIDRPSQWIIEREEREYSFADRIVVLSTFAYQTFVSEGVNSDKLKLLRLGTNARLFSASPEVIDARCRRILSDTPLRVLYVGALSLRKGLSDIDRIVRKLGPEGFRFLFIGPVSAEARDLAGKLQLAAEFVPKQPQNTLPRWYSDGDVFMFPTIEDGFPVVLAQAQANALPVLTTPNCCGPDLVGEGDNGWILPIREPQAFIDRLRWCDANRPALADMVRRLYATHRIRTWDDVAEDFETMCVEELSSLEPRREIVNA